jgi:hypothetical protein
MYARRAFLATRRRFGRVGPLGPLGRVGRFRRGGASSPRLPSGRRTQRERKSRTARSDPRPKCRSNTSTAMASRRARRAPRDSARAGVRGQTDAGALLSPAPEPRTLNPEPCRLPSAPERGKHSARSPAHGLLHGRSRSASHGGSDSNSRLSGCTWPLAITITSSTAVLGDLGVLVVKSRRCFSCLVPWRSWRLGGWKPPKNFGPQSVPLLLHP